MDPFGSIFPVLQCLTTSETAATYGLVLEAALPHLDRDLPRILLSDQDCGFFAAFNHLRELGLLAGLEFRLCSKHAWENLKQQLNTRRSCMTAAAFSALHKVAATCMFNAIIPEEVCLLQDVIFN
jgi:hypothetical protein